MEFLFLLLFSAVVAIPLLILLLISKAVQSHNKGEIVAKWFIVWLIAMISIAIPTIVLILFD